MEVIMRWFVGGFVVGAVFGGVGILLYVGYTW